MLYQDVMCTNDHVFDHSIRDENQHPVLSALEYTLQNLWAQIVTE